MHPTGKPAQREPVLIVNRWNGRAFSSADNTRASRGLSGTAYGSSRLTGSERRRLDRFAAAQAACVSKAAPRLVKVEKTLQVIALDDFLATRPVDEVVQVTALPQTLGRERVKRNLDEVLVGALREAF